MTQNGDDQLIEYEDNVRLDAWSDAMQENDSNSEQIYKDYSKPDGDACRDDGTLKDASEMEWPNSPSDSNPHDFNLGEENVILKRKSPDNEDDLGYENVELPKRR